MTKRNQNTEAIETIEAPVTEATVTETLELENQNPFENLDLSNEGEPEFEMDSFELSLDELDTQTARTITSKASSTVNSKKKSEAWLKAKELWHNWKSEEGKAIMKRYSQIHKAFKTHKLDKFSLVIGDYRVLFVADHTNTRSIERVLREFTFKNTIDGQDFHCTFEDAVTLHEINVMHHGRPAKNPTTKPEYFLITQKAV